MHTVDTDCMIVDPVRVLPGRTCALHQVEHTRGSPTASTTSASSAADEGVSSEGVTTTALPETNVGATFPGQQQKRLSLRQEPAQT